MFPAAWKSFFSVGEQGEAYHQEHSNPTNFILTKIPNDGSGAYEKLPACRGEVYTVGFTPEKVGIITKDSLYPNRHKSAYLHNPQNY